jgi:hypothetical protein
LAVHIKEERAHSNKTQHKEDPQECM